MNTRSKLSIFITVATAFITFACLGGTPATSTPAESTEASSISTEQVLPKNGKLEILNSRSYMDGFGDYNVVGELVNNTDQTLENVTLSLSITDESGNTLLKDSDENPVEQVDIQPYITVLAPGVSAPFGYYISADEVKPAKYEITVKDYDTTSAPDITRFDIANVQTNVVGDDVILTGEVVNLSSEQVDIETLAGAILDDAGNILAANSTLTYSRYLYPAGDSAGRDHGPFIVKLYGPIENFVKWKVYLRPVENAATSAPNMDVQLTGSYLDEYGTFHLLGNVTNNGSHQITPSVISDLHTSNKSIFDVASANVPFYLNAGESAPFDINTFQVVGLLTADDMSSVEKSARPDLYWSFNSSYNLVPLEKSTLKVHEENSSWTVTGTVTNTSAQALNNITALVQCTDANDQLLAINYTSLYPTESNTSIQPGATTEFSINLYPPADTQQLNNCKMTFQGVGAE